MLIDINNAAANFLFMEGGRPALANCGGVTPPNYSLPVVEARPVHFMDSGDMPEDMEFGVAARSPLEYRTKIKLGKLLLIYAQYPSVKDKGKLLSKIADTYVALFKSKVFGLGKLCRKLLWLHAIIKHMDIEKMDKGMLELLNYHLLFKLSLSTGKGVNGCIPLQERKDMSARSNWIENKLNMLEGNGYERDIDGDDVSAGDFIPEKDIPSKVDNRATALAALRVRKYEIRLAFAMDPKKIKDLGLSVEMARIHLDIYRIKEHMKDTNFHVEYNLISIANSYAQNAHELAPDDKDVLKLRYEVLALMKGMHERKGNIDKAEKAEQELKRYRAVLGIQDTAVIREENIQLDPLEKAMNDIETALAKRDEKGAERCLKDALGLDAIPHKKMKNFRLDKAFIPHDQAIRLKELNIEESEFRDILIQGYSFAFYTENKFFVYFIDSGVLYRILVNADGESKKVQYIRKCRQKST